MKRHYLRNVAFHRSFISASAITPLTASVSQADLREVSVG